MSDAIAQTRAGLVRGDERDGVRRWLGVPYAAAPVGTRRFRPPEPPAPWQGERDARKVGPVAMQQRESMLSGLTAKSLISEDCLSLNIYAPASGTGHPVLVWIHGGAFVMGAGSVPIYNGQSFAARHDLVVVTLNYRLGLFGFLLIDDLGGDQGNLGLLDQIAALAWVRDNIAAFGGDPSRVTVMGESAGAMSIAYMLAMPAARGLFHGAILCSGAGALEPPTRDAAEAFGTEVLGLLGVTREDLADVPAERILAVQDELLRQRGLAAVQPYIDGVNVPRAPRDAALAGEIARVPLLLGTNRDELALFDLAMPAATKIVEAQLRGRIGARADELRALYRSWSDVGGDAVFRIPAIRLAEVHPAPVYMYRLDAASPQFGGRLGAAHAIDLPLVWNNLANPLGQLLLGDVEPFRGVALRIHDTWAAFARTGVPDGGGLPAWPRYAAADRATLIIDRDTAAVERDPGGAQRELWNQLLAR